MHYPNRSLSNKGNNIVWHGKSALRNTNTFARTIRQDKDMTDFFAIESRCVQCLRYYYHWKNVYFDAVLSSSFFIFGTDKVLLSEQFFIRYIYTQCTKSAKKFNPYRDV